MLILYLHEMLALRLLAVLTVTQVTDPRPQGKWVSDMAGVITPDSEARIEALLQSLNAATGVQIGVVTVDDCEGTPKEFATALFNHWHIGAKGVDNGVLMLLVKDKRRLEIETGYGVEGTLPDGWLVSMQTEAMVPAFKRGDYGAGIEAGLERIAARLREDPTAHSDPAIGASRPSSGPSWPWAAGLGGGGAGLLLLGVRAARRRRERRCPKCKTDMRLLDEVADDAHLEAGQVKEEQVGSKDYRVHICPRCQFSRTVARTRWFSSYHKCPQCSFRTARTSSYTIVQATYTQGGQVEVDESCAHCSYNRRSIRHTARLTPPSTTGSSSGGSSSWSGGGGGGGGGGSWGGGSSGGGGGGSSW